MSEWRVTFEHANGLSTAIVLAKDLDDAKEKTDMVLKMLGSGYTLNTIEKTQGT